MKKPILFALGAFAALSGISQAATIAFWDFNNGYASTNSPRQTQIIHNATTGAGILYQQRADTDHNGKGGVAFDGSAYALGSVAAGVAMAWDDVAKTGANDAEFFIAFSTAGFTNLVVSFDIKGTSISSYDFKYALTGLVDVTNPPDVTGTIKAFDGTQQDVLDDSAVNSPTAFTRVTIDFSLLGITALDNQSTVSLRFDDWESNDDLSIDNFLITGTAVPEPSSALLGGVALLGLMRRRR
jgi:hypothetical protein